ncbi:FACT complex subunit POB3 [Bienertia sinuspersici]
MDLRATKEKLVLPIKSAEYRVGVDDFMVYATKSLTSSDGKLRCPCIKCVNNKLLSPDDVNYHLLHFGIMRNYYNWTFHGRLWMKFLLNLWWKMRLGEKLIYVRVKSMLEILNSQTLITPGWRINNIKVLVAEIKEVMMALGMKRKRTKDAFMNTLCKKRSKRGKESLMNAKVKPISTTGTKSHARVREELKKELKKSPTQTQTYLACHTHDNEAEITNQIKSIVAEQGDKEMNMGDDPVSKVLGKDQYGRVRGLGLGAKPSNFAEISAPPYCTGLNLSSKDERAIFYHLRQSKGWTQRLNKRVKRQDTTIKKLKSKLQSQFGFDFDDSDSNNSDSGSSDFDEDDDFNIHGVDKTLDTLCWTKNM